MTAKPDLVALTALRGIAAWFVLFYHIRLSTIDLLPPVVIDALAKGYLAVDFFFLLSGFVIWLSYHQRLAEGGTAAVIPFLQRRFARIYPLHFVIMMGAIGFAAMLALTGRASPEEYPPAELPLHLLLLQNWGFTDTLSWNVPAWSISTEMAAYLFFPIIIFSIDWRQIPTALLLATLAAIATLIAVAFNGFGVSILDGDVPRTGLLRCIAQFAMGTIICALWLRLRGSAAVPAFWLSLAIGTGVAFAGIAGWISEPATVPLAFAAFLLAAALAAEAERNPLRARPFVYLGEISYATYLVHYLLFVAYKILFVGDDLQLGWATLVGFFVLAFVASAALYHLVEKPSQRILNGWFDRSASRGKVAASR